MNRLSVFLGCLLLIAARTFASTLQLPTANQAIFAPGQEEKYFVGTTGKPWMSGTFGCVRSSGWQMHEGIDIRCLQRDKRGEPIDPVMATADGVVAYVNRKPSLSNYGNYIVLQHRLDGLDIFSTYAHLSQIGANIKVGQPVTAGETIGVMGRTTNTREQISKERAHVHFELNFFINENFSGWYRKNYPKQRNDHGIWNGQNMIGIDPRAVLIASRREGARFNLVNWVQNQTELCRVFVRDTNFPWLKRYSALVKGPAPTDTVGYELVLNFNGLPFQVIPRAGAEWKTGPKVRVLSVNNAEAQANPCRKLVTSRRGKPELAPAGVRLMELVTY